MTRGLAAGAVALVLLGGVGVTRALTAPEPTAAPAVSPTPAATASLVAPTATPTATPGGAGSTGPGTPSAEPTVDPREALEGTRPEDQEPTPPAKTLAAATAVASEAVVAYFTWSWTDPGPLAWRDRVLAYGDRELRDALTRDFPLDEATQAAWDQIVKDRTERRATVLEATLSTVPGAWHPDRADHLTLTVQVAVDERSATGGAADGTGDGAGAWRRVMTPTMQAVLTRQGGRWLLSDLIA